MSSVQDIAPVVAAMQLASQVCRDLDGGTTTMRSAGKAYLPIWPHEDEASWKSRRDATFLFPALRKALDTMTGQPFCEEIVLGQDVPAEIIPHLENIDLAGRDLDSFARDVFRETLRDGIGWILVDYPLVSAPFANLAAEKAAGVRPYWVHIPLARMLGYRIENRAGKMVVVQVRFREDAEVPNGEFGTKTEQRIRVIEPGMVRVFRKGNDWEMIPELSGPTTMLEIPMVAIHFDRTGFWQARPCMEDLAHLNVAHWQSTSEQRHALHFGRVLPLAADSDDRVDQGDTVTLKSGGVIVGLPGLRYLEVSNTGSLEAGRTDLADLEDQMRRVAGELLSGDTSKTATQTSIEAGEGSAGLKARVKQFQDCLEECMRLHALWMRIQGGGSLVINTEWDEGALNAQMIQALTQARQAGAISQETYSYQMAKGGLLPPDRSPEQEMESLNSEGPQAMTTPLV